MEKSAKEKLHFPVDSDEAFDYELSKSKKYTAADFLQMISSLE